MFCQHQGHVCRLRAACKHLFKNRTAAIEHGVKAELPDLPIKVVDTRGVRPNNRTFVVTGAATRLALGSLASIALNSRHLSHAARIS